MDYFFEDFEPEKIRRQKIVMLGILDEIIDRGSNSDLKTIAQILFSAHGSLATDEASNTGEGELEKKITDLEGKVAAYRKLSDNEKVVAVLNSFYVQRIME